MRFRPVRTRGLGPGCIGVGARTVTTRPVRLIRSSALVKWNRYKHRIRVDREFLQSRVVIVLIAGVRIFGRVACFRFIRTSLPKYGCRIHSVDWTYFTRRRVVTAWTIGKGFLTIYRTFPNLACWRYLRAHRLILCDRRGRRRCWRSDRINSGQRLRGCLANSLGRQIGGCKPASARTSDNRNSKCRDHQSTQSPREVATLVHCQIIPLITREYREGDGLLQASCLGG